MAVSPSILLREFELPELAVALGDTRPAMIGGATKGPVNKPIRTRTAAEFIETFGPPTLDDVGVQSALKYFEKGDNLLYMRVADGDEDVADRTIPGLEGGTPAEAATGTIVFTGGNNPADGETVTIWDGSDATFADGTIEFTDNPSDGDSVTIDDTEYEFDDNASITGDVLVEIGSSAADTMQNLIAAIQANQPGVVTVEDISSSNPEIRVTSVQPGLQGNTLVFEASGAEITISGSGFLTGGSNGTGRTFEFDDDSNVTGGNIGVLIGATAAITMGNLIQAINGSPLTITATDTTVTVPQATLTHNVPGFAGNIPITDTGANIAVTGMSGGSDSVPGSSGNLLVVKAKSPGTWGNSIQVRFRDSVVPGAPAGNFDLLVFAPPAADPNGPLSLVETFANLSLDASSPRFIERLVEDGVRGESEPSRFIEVDVLEVGTPNAGTFQLGSGGGTVGANGITNLSSAHYIGTYNGPASTGLQALANKDRWEFNLLAVPGVSHASVIAAMFELIEDPETGRGDALVVVDPPFGLDAEQVIDWHNGLGAGHGIPNSPATPLETSFGALYWAWQRHYDQFNDADVWLPPSGLVLANAAESDREHGAWIPYAGYVRGVLNSLEAEYSPDERERDELIGDGSGNKVNPISEFPALNEPRPVIFGNRTLVRDDARLLGDVHIRRMLLHIKKFVASAVSVLIFDPNDSVTWGRFRQLTQPVLDDVMARRGLVSARVICDANTNPPELRKQRILSGKFVLEPARVGEKIVIDFMLTQSGAENVFNESVI